MPDSPIQFTGSILEQLETKVAAEAAHLLPIVHAIRDHGVGFLVREPSLQPSSRSPL